MASPAFRVPIPKNGVDYRGKVVLAPMVRSGELPTRLLALKYGADLVWGPETIDRSLIGTTRVINPYTQTIDFTRRSNKGAKKPSPLTRPSIIFRIHPSERPYLVYQLGTSSPSLAVQAASMVAPDVAGIDVNAGCPKPFSTIGGMGAALLRKPELLCSILSALVNEVGTPHQIGISVKIRLLETAEQMGALVTALCKTGITGLTIHCRTTPMRPRERALRHHLALIASICREHGVACLMNGDVSSRAEAETLIQEYGVDGAMIATAAEANPSCFLRPTAHSSSSSDRYPSSNLLPWQTFVKDYLPICLSTDNKYGNTKFMLNHFINGKDPAHRKIVQSRSYSEAVHILGLEELKNLAIEVDERLGLGLKNGGAMDAENVINEQQTEDRKEEEAGAEDIGLANLETLTTALDQLERDLPHSEPIHNQHQHQQQHYHHQQRQQGPLPV